MNLLIVFGNRYPILDDAFYITQFHLSDINSERQFIVSPNNSDQSEIRDNSDAFRFKLIDDISTQFISESIDSNFHNFYFHVFRHTYKWWFEIRKVLEQNPNIKNIIISDAIRCSYMPLYEAEGEINKPLFYKRYDSIPYALYCSLRKLGFSVKVLKWHSKFGLFIRIFVRRYLVIFFKLAMYFFIFLKSINIGVKKRREISNLVLSRSIAHTHFFHPMFRFFKDSTIFLYSNGFLREDLNSIFFKRQKKIGLNIYKFSNFFDLFSGFAHVISSLIKIRFCIPKYWIINDLQIPIRSVFKEAIIAYYDGFIYGKAVKRACLFYCAKRVFTAETFTQYPFVIKNSLPENVSSLQFANGALDILPNTKFVYADRFVISSNAILEKYLENHPMDANKMVYWGDARIIEEHVKELKLINSIVFFSQPYEYESQILILDSLNDFAKSKQLNFKVKVHPRDFTTKNFCKTNHICIIDSHLSIDEYINDFDVAICRSSSIIKDIILRGKPIILVLLTDREKEFKNEFMNSTLFKEFKEIYAFSIQEMLMSLSNPNSLSKIFQLYMKNYINENVAGQTITDLVNKMEENYFNV
jgi:hypothetical protein